MHSLLRRRLWKRGVHYCVTNVRSVASEYDCDLWLSTLCCPMLLGCVGHVMLLWTGDSEAWLATPVGNGTMPTARAWTHTSLNTMKTLDHKPLGTVQFVVTQIVGRPLISMVWILIHTRLCHSQILLKMIAHHQQSFNHTHVTPQLQHESIKLTKERKGLSE